jgi:hypothetical protein
MKSRQTLILILLTLSACVTAIAQTPIYKYGKLIIPHNAEGPKYATGELMGISSFSNTPHKNSLWYWKDVANNHVFFIMNSAELGSGYEIKISDALAKSERFKSTRFESYYPGKRSFIKVELPEDGFILNYWKDGIPEPKKEMVNGGKTDYSVIDSFTPKTFIWYSDKGIGDDIWIQFAEIKFKEVFGIK